MLSAKASDDTFVESKEGMQNKFRISDSLRGSLPGGMLECGQIDKGGEAHIRLWQPVHPHREARFQMLIQENFRVLSPGWFRWTGCRSTSRGAMSTPTSSLDRLTRCGVHLGKAWMDCGSYSRVIVNITSRHCDTFYIRAMMCDSPRVRILAIAESDWGELVSISFF